MFNPFPDKQLSDLDAHDLAGLFDREVAEGHYVEYKSDLIKASKIAKSVSAFANSHGGWLFLGIDSDPQSNIPTRVTGIDTVKHPNVADTI